MEPNMTVRDLYNRLSEILSEYGDTEIRIEAQELHYYPSITKVNAFKVMNDTHSIVDFITR